jgi:hypothetical protein
MSRARPISAEISSAAIFKHQRLDAKYYLGDKEILDGTNIRKAEKRLQDAQANLARAKQAQLAEQARVAQLKFDGDVKEFP